jgi:hypothetical protein
VPDGGGEGEDALQDADDHAAGSVTAVSFQVKLSFEGVVDRFDDLAQRLEVLSAGPRGSPFRAGRGSRIPSSAMAASKSRP